MSWVLLIAAIVVSFLVFTLLVRVVKATIGTAIAIALVVLVLQIGFGIAPHDLWQQMVDLWNSLFK